MGWVHQTAADNAITVKPPATAPIQRPHSGLRPTRARTGFVGGGLLAVLAEPVLPDPRASASGTQRRDPGGWTRSWLPIRPFWRQD